MIEDPDPTTEELRIEQSARQRAETERADEAVREGAPEEAAQHDRRAEKAAYLRERLEDRKRAEEEAADGMPEGSDGASG